MSEPIQLTSEEIQEIDQMMNDHMYGHTVSNNYASFTCGARCRTEALGSSINRVLREKHEKETGYLVIYDDSFGENVCVLGGRMTEAEWTREIQRTWSEIPTAIIMLVESDPSKM